MNMVATDQWITWERRRRTGGVSIVTRRQSEGNVGMFGTSRPATEEEIKNELARRAECDETHEKLQRFRERPEFALAIAIRDRIEHMTPDDHPLDGLGVDEWKSLAEKLTK